MTVTVKLPKLDADSRQQIRDAVLLGKFSADVVDDSLRDAALRVAEALPAIVRRMGLPDGSESRERVLNVMMAHTLAPKGRRPSYRSIRQRR